MTAGKGKMISWLWLNIPLMVLFVCCWAGIRLWHVLTRCDAELKVKHARGRRASGRCAGPGAAGSGSRALGRQPGLRGSC